MAPDNAELVRRGFEAAARGDLDAVRGFLAPDVKWHAGDAEASGACRNRGQALEFLRAAWKRGRVGELVEVIEAGDKVVVIMRPPSAGDGEARTVANVTTLREGRAVEIVHYPDADTALRAAGVVR